MKEVDHWRTEDNNGLTMPWYTRGCCEWLESIDWAGKRVWEYGGGMSTLWYRHRGAIVDGVDADKDWAKIAELLFTDYEERYLLAIDSHAEFDLICIDGHFRDRCLAFALPHLKKGGAVIIDNWKQASAGWAEWPETEKLIKNMKVTEYHEPGHEDWVTIKITR